MHHTLIPSATKEQLDDFLYDEFDELRAWDRKLYDRMEAKLYERIHGPHFCKETYDLAVASMRNSDGTAGPHWAVSEITSYAKSKGLAYKDFNEYDFAYAMNMVYSDYHGVVNDSTETYYRIAKAFIEDADAPIGKAYLYYRAMNC